MTVPKPLRRALTEATERPSAPVHGDAHRTWVLGAKNADVVQAIARLVGDVHAFSFDHRDAFAECGAWSCERDFAHAVVFLPQGRRRQRMAFAMAAAVLHPKGTIHVVGEKQLGIKPARRVVVEFFGELLGTDSGDHVQCISASEPQPEPISLEAFADEVTLAPPGGVDTPLRVRWYPGVFGANKLDEGTALLLRALADVAMKDVTALDVGCGSGILGAALARRGATVDLVDVDALALLAATETLALNDLPGRVLPSDGVHARTLRDRYDLIATNPPFHQGRKTEYDVARAIISEAPQRLRPGGQLVLVANAFLPYRDALDAAFGAHDVLAENRRFRVYRARTR